ARMVARLEHYLRIAGSPDGTARPLPPIALYIVASAWAKVPDSEEPEVYTKLRAAAAQAFAAASQAGDMATSAYSQILIGNSLLREAGFSALNSVKAELTASDCGLMERACEALTRAAEIAAASGHAAAEAQALRELGAALGRRITHCASP